MPITPPLPDYTPEEKARVLAEMKKQFTIEKFIEYLEDDTEKFPADQVLSELEEIVNAAESGRPEPHNG